MAVLVGYFNCNVLEDPVSSHVRRTDLCMTHGRARTLFPSRLPLVGKLRVAEAEGDGDGKADGGRWGTMGDDGGMETSPLVRSNCLSRRARMPLGGGGECRADGMTVTWRSVSGHDDRAAPADQENRHRHPPESSNAATTALSSSPARIQPAPSPYPARTQLVSSLINTQRDLPNHGTCTVRQS